MTSITRFLAYNNAVPLIAGVLFLGASGALAATPEGRDAVFSTEESVVSVDNSRIVNADLGTYPFAVQVTGVTEDDFSYYVAYTLATIDLVDQAWKDSVQEKVLTVSKAALSGGDLGLYATAQIAEVREAEKARLIETQQWERANGLSQKTIATQYGGLVGRFLDPTTETLPGYVPVVIPPTPQVTTVPVSPVESQQPVAPTDAPSIPGTTPENPAVPTAPAPTTVSSGDPSDSVPPSIVILGNNPARIGKRTAYADLGALVTDNLQINIGYETLVDGVAVPAVNLDTSVERTYTITYRAVDRAGNSAEASRIVEVYNQYAQ